MFKQSSSRNQRTKGFKVKHALQVFVLVAVCIWLLYQVKHYHDKKRTLEERNTKISTVVEDSHSDDLRFGRKDLPQVAIETNLVSETHGDDEGNEDAEEEAENRLQEGDEEEAKDAVEDEIDENDQEGEGADEEGEHGEETHDEEKEGESDEQGLSTIEERDNMEANIQEAREEHYKGDDASSAVVRVAEITESETRNNIEEQIENIEKDPDVNNNTIGTVDGLKLDESGVLTENSEIHLFNGTSMNNTKLDEFGVPVEKSEIHLSNDTYMNNTSLSDGEHETEVQENLILTDHHNLVVNQANSTAEPQFALIQVENNSTDISNSENDSSPLQNSTTGTASGPDQIWTRRVVTGTWKVYNTTVNGSSKSNISIERTVNSNPTDGDEKVEKNPSLSSANTDDENASKSHNAVKADSNDPLAKVVDTVTEEENDARTDLLTLPETETKTKVEEFAAE